MDKKGKTIAVIAVIILLLAGGIAAYALSNNQGKDPTGTTDIEDIKGRTVAVPNQVDKVVCIAAGSLRLMSYMGASDLVVGIDSSDSSSDVRNNYATYLIAYDYSKVPNVGDANNETSYKAIMETGAQVIITSKTSVDELNNLQTVTGIPVVAIDAGGNLTIKDANFKKNIEIMGKVLNKEGRAKELLNAVDSFVAELESYSKTVSDKAKAYVGGLTYYKQSGLYMTSGNFVGFDLAGVSNVMPYVSGLPYNIEIPSRLAEAEPDYMFIDSMSRTSCYNKYLEDKDVLSVIPAIKNGDVYLLFASKYYGTNWETEIMNAYLVGKTVNTGSYQYDLDEKINKVIKAFFPNSKLTVSEIYKIQGWTPDEELI